MSADAVAQIWLVVLSVLEAKLDRSLETEAGWHGRSRYVGE